MKKGTKKVNKNYIITVTLQEACIKNGRYFFRDINNFFSPYTDQATADENMKKVYKSLWRAK